MSQQLCERRVEHNLIVTTRQRNVQVGKFVILSNISTLLLNQFISFTSIFNPVFIYTKALAWMPNTPNRINDPFGYI